ncbi:hypothetical protein HD806DRAFT_388891 [Xylariaceae sp. AK1471]|nr:hypothetical protein HD806DRAFT_388891 [Xylariaceae sp. AK1471]
MNTIGKIQASLSSATQETTLALANANFDFSLIKIEAPAEYRELGLALPKKKRSEAEDGSVHVTAQRLGSLFHSILPETPSLIQAYGQRASEIAKSLATSPQADEAYGPFRDYLGVDGTSIWAAATSGSAAIACHLLACMLACCWRPEEATAIWLEIVSERKRQLEEKVTQAEYFNLVEAVSSKLSLDKEQLAIWDNSARAWLAAANDSPPVRLRQKAVRGLLNKVNSAVHSQQDVFTSVTTAWKLALETLEKVICGMSCSIADGAVVIALMSWHLYPDLILLSPETLIINQKDDLVQSSQITIGLARPDTGGRANNQGVHWSLSLAHLRYYGSGRVTSRSLHCTPSGNPRFTFDEFLLIFLGACMSKWSQWEEITIQAATDFIILAMSKFDEVLSTAESFPSHVMEGSWIRLIGSALAIFKKGSQSEQSSVSRFLSLGWRYPSLVEVPSPYEPLVCYHSFGLGTLQFAQVLLNEADQESYVRDSIKDFMTHRPYDKHSCILFVSRSDGHENTELTFYSRASFKSSKLGRGQYEEIRELLPDGGYVIKHKPGAIKTKLHEEDMLWKGPPRPIRRLLLHCSRFESEDDPEGAPEFEFTMIAKTRSHIVYRPCTNMGGYNGIPVSTRQVQHYLSTKAIKPSGLLHFLQSSSFFGLLRVLSAGKELYTGLPGATISPNVLETNKLFAVIGYHGVQHYDVRNVRHHRTRESILRHQFTQGTAFRLLVFLETGHYASTFGQSQYPGPPGHEWNRIFAVSTENTLYIDPMILSNPKTDTSGMYGIRRVQGNVGMPGLTLIGWYTNSYELDLKKPDPNNWQIVNHHPFDGKLEDYFSGTSLHLRFTGYSQALNFGAHNRIANGTLVEAVVSAFDQGQWVGDIDIMRALQASRYLRTVHRRPGCHASTVNKLPQQELIAIENWEELLSHHPSLPGVVKCHGNWQARLTAASLCVQLQYRTLLFDSHGCWDCAFETLDTWDRVPLYPKSPSTVSSSKNSEEGSGDEEVPGDSTEAASKDLEDHDSDTRDTDDHNESSSDEDASSVSGVSISGSDISGFRPQPNASPIIFIL